MRLYKIINIILSSAAVCVLLLHHTLAQNSSNQLLPVENQLKDYAKSNPVRSTLTSSAGEPVSDPTNSLTAGPRGPIVMDTTFFDIMQAFNRERIPERVVHGKGAGASGTFQVTHDITRYSKAQVFSRIGLKTNVSVRFSQVSGESGSADTVRDVRGFSVKFQTDDGIWDLVGNNLPVFFIRDAIMFPDLIHSQRRNPQTHLHDNNMYWDFATRRPETMYLVMYVNTGLGIPSSYRHMHGYGVHAFRLVNAEGQVVYAKFHWRSQQGVSNLTNAEANRLAGTQPDFYIEDLYNAIARANYPKWTLNIQVMTMQQAMSFKWNPFDSTKEWPETEYPLIPVGEMELNRNQVNYFVDVEQIAFCPGRLVPGIEPSPDKLLQGRIFAYPDTQTYRLGSNNQLLKANRPVRTKVSNYERDGFARPGDDQDNAPNYYPNSFNGPQPTSRGNLSTYPVQGDIARYDTSNDDNLSQPKMFWQSLSSAEKQFLMDNFATALKRTYPAVQQRAVENFYQVDQNMGKMLAKSIGISVPL